MRRVGNPAPAASTTLARLAASGPDATEQGLRRQFLAPQDLDAVEAILAQLEAGQ